MFENIGLIIVLAIGLLFVGFRPLSRFFLTPRYWDISAGAGVLIILIIYLMTAIVTPGMIEEDLAKEPCGSQSPQGACYKLDPNLCRSLWDKSFSECKQELANNFNAHPTALIGPVINRCSARKMDKAVRYNRANSTTGYCQSYFRYIEEQH